MTIFERQDSGVSGIAAGRHWSLRFMAWAATTFGAALIGSVATMVFAIFVWPGIHTVPNAERQLENVRNEIAHSGRLIVTDQVVPLRGHGDRTHLIITRSDDVPLGASDEVRLYDVVNGDLRRSFRFAPKIGGYVSRFGHAGMAWEFELRGVSDIDGDGRDELIGDFTPEPNRVIQSIGAGGSAWTLGELRYPVVIRWSDSHLQYRIEPLIDSRPSIFNKSGALPKRLYGTPASLVDARTGRTIHAYGAEEWRFARSDYPADSTKSLYGIYISPRSGRLWFAKKYTVVEYQTNLADHDLNLARPVSFEGDPVLEIGPWCAFGRYSPSRILDSYVRLRLKTIPSCATQ